MEFGFESDVGKKREIDEDSIAALTFNSVINSNESEFGLFIVADGMGGHNAGEIASSIGTKIVTQNIVNEILQDSNEKRESGDFSFYKLLLENSIIKANSAIFSDSLKNPEHEGMGTTIVTALIIGNNLYVGNVGDSRAYRINESEMFQLTKDHSLVQDLVDSGKISSDEVKNHPQNNIVTRIVGYYSDVEVDTFNCNLFGDDKILLCCDGLTDLVSDEEIKEIVLSLEDPQEVCEKLVKCANDRGGKDNISVILVQLGNVKNKTDVIEAETLVKKSPIRTNFRF